MFIKRFSIVLASILCVLVTSVASANDVNKEREGSGYGLLAGIVACAFDSNDCVLKIGGGLLGGRAWGATKEKQHGKKVHAAELQSLRLANAQAAVTLMAQRDLYINGCSASAEEGGTGDTKEECASRIDSAINHFLAASESQEQERVRYEPRGERVGFVFGRAVYVDGSYYAGTYRGGISTTPGYRYDQPGSYDPYRRSHDSISRRACSGAPGRRC